MLLLRFQFFLNLHGAPSFTVVIVVVENASPERVRARQRVHEEELEEVSWIRSARKSEKKKKN